MLTVLQGTYVSPPLSAVYRTGPGGSLTDPVNPRVSIIDSDEVTRVNQAVPTRESIGQYRFDYMVPPAAPVGIWTVIWSGVILGVYKEASENFEVVASGYVTIQPRVPSRRHTVQDRALIKSTTALISSHPRLVSLTRYPVPISDGAGGMRVVGAAVTLSPAVRYFAGTTGTELFIVTDDGQRVQADAVLIGPVGDDMRKGDEFTLDNADYRVEYIDPKTLHYQTKGYCTYKESGNRGF